MVENRFRVIAIVMFTALSISFNTPLMAQMLLGVVKSDSAFIPIDIPNGETADGVSAKWGLGKAALESNANKLLIPVAAIIRQFSCEGCIPVYHSVQQSEGLYRIGKWYGNIGVSRLKALNQLRSESLQKGQRLLVGYILPGTEWKPPATKSVTQVAVQEKPVDAPLLSYTGPGFFMSEWQPPVQEKTAMVKAASFKSESGWSDGKFYLLHSHYSVGTILKITHPASGKYLFAKVVGPLPDLKMNNGLMTRVNDAAAAMLGTWDESTFDVVIGF